MVLRGIFQIQLKKKFFASPMTSSKINECTSWFWLEICITHKEFNLTLNKIILFCSDYILPNIKKETILKCIVFSYKNTISYI